MSLHAERLDTAVGTLPYTRHVSDRTHRAQATVRHRQSEDTVLLAFARLVPSPEPADHTESAESQESAPSSYVVDQVEDAGEPERDVEESETPSATLQLSADRRQLLARQFARKSMSPEHLARLSILEERLRVLAPQVDENALARLEEARARIAGTDELLDRVRRELSTDE